MPATYHDLDWPRPINWSRRAGINRGLIAWWLGVPDRAKGAYWLDLLRQRVGTLTNMNPSADWVAASRRAGTRCLDLDGTNDYVSIANFPGFKPALPVSISCWALFRDTTGHQPLFTNDATLEFYYGTWMHVSVTTLVLNASFGSGGAPGPTGRRSKSGATTLSTGVWYFVSCSIRGATDMSLYINGANDGGTYSGSGGALTYNGTTAGAIGLKDANAGAGNEDYANALLDDVRFWGRSLTDAEHAQLYRESRAGYPNLLRRRRPVAKAQAAAGIVYPRLERGIRGLNRGLSLGTRG